MESKLIRTKEVIAEKLDLPRDVVVDIPKITIVGNNELTIENHKGVAVFDEDKMKINSNVGLITIYGHSFEILFMGGSTLTVRGKFKSMEYEDNV